ncbi:plasmid mobilization protein [Actinocorallia herbida]|uniref:plasmid mobilization protein n=1 Tax=Actinocorallia herbida TaxID=58109 RepID=UPI001476E729|nr:plasmid mobilization relaxosome protein MobC [Actinocorallia herbida]
MSDGYDEVPTQRVYRRRGDEPRRRCLCLRLSESEYEIITAAASRQRVTRTFFAAEAVLLVAREDAPVVREADRALLREVMEGNRQIRRVGGNLNQIALRLNASGECPPELGWCLELVAGSLQRLDSLAMSLDELIHRR